MNITFAMIVYNSDLVLRQVFESIRDYGKIIVVEGPVEYFWEDDYEDDTVEMCYANADKLIRGKWEEKTEMCQAFMPHIAEDTDYLWCIDADEVFKPEDIEQVIKILEQRKPASLGFRSYSFFGGFTSFMTGYEWKHNFKRVLRFTPGCSYVNHRPPTLDPAEGEHIKHAAMMYHYSYVSPIAVQRKIDYYKNAGWQGNPNNIKNDYFEKVFLKWQKEPELTELHNNGVHEFKTMHSYTEKFIGTHPKVIQDSMEDLEAKIKKQYADIL